MNGQLLNGGYFQVEELSFLQLNMVKTDLMREGKIMKEQEILEAVEKMRIDWKKNDDKRDSGLPHDLPEIKRVDDIQYGNDPKWNLLDIYLPKNIEGKILCIRKLITLLEIQTKLPPCFPLVDLSLSYQFSCHLSGG